MQTQTSNTLHNAIMEAGSEDRPPMLAHVDACLNVCEIWKAIERLKQGKSINVQDLETNLYWEFRNSHLRMVNPWNRITQEWQRFVTLVKQSQKLKTISYHKLYDILKQHQHKVNEIRAGKIARIANLLALVAKKQPVYHPQTHPTHYTQNSSTRSQQAATRNKGKAIINSSQPIYDQEPSMKIYKPTNNNLRTSSNTSHANQDNSLRINRSAGYENQRIGNVAEARETVEIVLFIVDSGCSKHMMGNLKLLINFVEKFLGTIKFGNDQIAPILGYGDLVQGAVTIKRVHYFEGLNHNLFSVLQFCNADLEVAFRKSTCFIHDLKGKDLLTGSRGMDLYSITLQDTNCPNLICLMAKASSSQAWLCHLRLSHLNFDTINLLSKNDIVVGLPKLKFVKDHLCSSCELGKAKRKFFYTKLTPSLKRRLQLLHTDLCGPMRVASINGKRYVLVIVDDYSRYIWTQFLRSKDETPKVLIDFLRLVQRGLQAQVRVV
nr:retrovirus-related Pol polyprotein from transposon TNT 1-94 [Tanacetum cinerariifolium]